MTEPGAIRPEVWLAHYAAQYAADKAGRRPRDPEQLAAWHERYHAAEAEFATRRSEQSNG